MLPELSVEVHSSTSVPALLVGDLAHYSLGCVTPGWEAVIALLGSSRSAPRLALKKAAARLPCSVAAARKEGNSPAGKEVGRSVGAVEWGRGEPPMPPG